jgi:4-aminobutyrate aminotransferase-like enzyme/Ser/Thr protein kinase RdoA (MazF antagonist)
VSDRSPDRADPTYRYHTGGPAPPTNMLEDAPSATVGVPEAEALARELFGVEASARALPGEYDHNFHLTRPAAEPLVLKVMHPLRDRALVELQIAALEHLAAKAPDLTLPRVVRGRDGGPLQRTTDRDRRTCLVWMLTYVPGTTLAEARPRSPELLASLGRFLGALDAGLDGFAHPGARRDLKWDLARAGWIRGHLDLLEPTRRALVEAFLEPFENDVARGWPRLRKSVIHGDANDHNVLVGSAREGLRQVRSVIDFGDMVETATVCELAIAAAYAGLGTREPLAAAAAVVSGYHAAFPLGEDELPHLHTLIGLRLAVSVTNSALRKSSKPDDPYVTISEAPAWTALQRLAAVPPRLAHYAFRHACGFEPVPEAGRIVAWLRANADAAAPVLETDLRTAPSAVFDLGVGSTLLGADPAASETRALTDTIFAEMERRNVRVGVGRYDEARLLYASPLFAGPEDDDERRTVHLGLDLFVSPGSPVCAPFAGTVHTVANNPAPLDYGPLVILRHETDSGEAFFTLYGHLSEDSLEGKSPGQPVARGEGFARVGAPPGNGGWPPHVHFQLILDLLGLGRDFPGVARASERAVWTSLSPDPNLVVGIPADRFPPASPPKTETLAGRRARVGPNLSVSYREPLEIVRGFGCHLHDETGRAYLDVYNNVPLVGHSHPRVVRAAQAQLGLLNTNTRYLHDNLVRYAARLTALLPAPLRVVYVLSSGSEANELALRLARARTGSDDVIVLEHAYHGNTNTLIDVSPYKFDGPGGRGRRPWVHVAPLPDDYRGPYRRDDPERGRRYAGHVADIVERLRSERRGPAAFLAETLPSVGGQIVLPPGYLPEAYRAVRAAGGVAIADEVQVGFGRLGAHFWGFSTQGAVPDVVVLGKPIGNGFPLAAVVTTPEIAASFDNGMEFFSTFGGNPVACAVGLAVLDVLADEGLPENARRVGERLKVALTGLQDRHALVGDVRGMGLFLGVELVRDRATLEPASAEASYVVNRLRDRAILAGTDGPFHNVLKIRPPLVFTEADAAHFAATLDDILGEDAAQP